MYDNDGLIQRFQAVVYADEKPFRHVDRPADDDAHARVAAILKPLREIQDYRNGGATGGDGEIPGVRFNLEAQGVFNQWLIALEHRIQTSKEHPLIIEHLAKYRSFVPALALINHLVRKADEQTKEMSEVCQADVEMAIAQAAYFESHARRIYSLVLGGLSAAVKLSGRILSGDLEDGFTARDVYRNGWSQLNSIEAVEEACQVLIGKQWLKSERASTGEQGGRPTVRYRINPKVYRFADMPKS